MARCFSYLFSIAKRWLTWSWTYLWILWLMLVAFLIYILRGPLKINENLNMGMCRRLLEMFIL